MSGSSENLLYRLTAVPPAGSRELTASPVIEIVREPAGSQRQVRKLIAFDDDTFAKLTQLGRDRMATIQELADEAFADVLKKHGIRKAAS
jgi:hypothetical protein